MKKCISLTLAMLMLLSLGSTCFAEPVLLSAKDAEAQLNLGNYLLDGRGGPVDKEQGAEWLRKAAEQGLPEAMYNLGLCYHFGYGVEKSSFRAYSWVRDAERAGYAPAKKTLKDWGY